MPIELPPDAVVNEFHGPTTRHTRRIEIYEEDGITRWERDTGNFLKGGSVSVDYDRDERRSVELILENSSGILQNAPGELWYDKIIKVFRGVAVLEPERIPKIIVISEGGGGEELVSAFRTAMSAVGFGDIRINPLAMSLADLEGYDIVVGINSVNSARLALLQDAYEAGYPVITLGTSNVATLGTSVFGSGAYDETVEFSPTAPLVSPIGASHAVANGWSGFRYTYLEEPVEVDLPIAPALPADVYAVAKNGDRLMVSVREFARKTWVMYHGLIDAGVFEKPQFRNFLVSAFNYLNPVQQLDHWEVQVGEFMIDRISEVHFPHEVRITGRDYTKKCLLSKYLHPTQFDAGEKFEDVIAAIAGAAGITKRILPVTNITIDRDFFFDADTTRWEAMKEIATAYNHELFFDPTGYLVARPFNDPATTSPTITIRTGPNGQIATYEKSTSDSELFNSIIVVGESSDSEIENVWAVAKNEDPNSPSSIQQLGERVYRYSSAFITSEEQAQELANTFLSIYAMESFELSMDILMSPWLEVGDIIRWIDPRPAPGDPDTFLLSSINLPLALGPMSATGKRVTIVN